jgi:hypothetical protein
VVRMAGGPSLDSGGCKYSKAGRLRWCIYSMWSCEAALQSPNQVAWDSKAVNKYDLGWGLGAALMYLQDAGGPGGDALHVRLDRTDYYPSRAGALPRCICSRWWAWQGALRSTAGATNTPRLKVGGCLGVFAVCGLRAALVYLIVG